MSDKNEIFRLFVRYSTMPFEFFVFIGLGAFAGNFLDKKYETDWPYFAVSLAAFGFFAAVYHIIKSLKNEK